jgi:hypothetical protein
VTTHDFEKARVIGEAEGFGGFRDVPVILLQRGDDDLSFGLGFHRFQAARRR